MNNCIHLKQKFNNKLECKKTNKLINISDCKNCPYKEYKKYARTVKNYAVSEKKHTELTKTNQIITKMNRKSSKLAKLERNRFSLFTNDLEHCYFCGKKKDNIHEVIFGKNRINSIKYGLTLPLCLEHHRLMHKDTALIKEYKQKGQALFNKTYPDLVFEDIFRQNYL